MFKVIACINTERALGKEGKLLYHIGNDLSNFKSMTTGNVVIMGRTTFESLPGGKPLNDRINIIITGNDEYSVEPADNVYIVHSVEDAVSMCKTLFPDKEHFVIGGAQIYAQFIESNLVDEMRLTIVKDNTEGDVYFPEYSEDEWYTYYKSMAQVSSWQGVDRAFYYTILKRRKVDEC